MVVLRHNNGAMDCPSLCVGVFKPNRIGFSGGIPSTSSLCTLNKPYIIPSRVLADFRRLYFCCKYLFKFCKDKIIYIYVFLDR